MQRRLERIQFLDFMRGFAVIVMIVGHSIDAVLSNEARESGLFALYTFCRGFTAPMFLFVSGCAFAIATEKRWVEFRTPGRVVSRRFLKILLLFTLGYGLHLPYFSLRKIIVDATQADMMLLFQVDVLHCIAASMLILQILILITRTEQRFAIITLGMAVLMVIATPLVWSVDFGKTVSPLVAPYFNEQQPTLFPLFPFAAYLFLGVVVGHFFLVAYRAHRERAYFERLFIASVIVAVCGYLLMLFPVTVYPPHDFAKANPSWFLMRVGIIVTITSGFFFVRRIPQKAAFHLTVLGQSSLFVYVTHLLVVYGSAVNNGLAQFIGHTLSLTGTLAVVLGVLLCMIMCVHVWRYVQNQHLTLARTAQILLAGTMMFLFVARPH